MDKKPDSELATNPLLQTLEIDCEVEGYFSSEPRPKVGPVSRTSIFLPGVHILIILLYSSIFYVSFQRLPDHECTKGELIYCKLCCTESIEQYSGVLINLQPLLHRFWNMKDGHSLLSLTTILLPANLGQSLTKRGISL